MPAQAPPPIDYNIVFNTFGFTHIDADGSATIGTNSITDQRPSYVDETEENYRLRQNSVGEDAGDPYVSDEMTNLHAVLFDFELDMRPTNSGPDMGADEINSCLLKVGDAIFSVLQEAIDYAEAQNITEILMARGECRGVLEKERHPSSGLYHRRHHHTRFS